jgi:hypothetical protein
VKKKRKDKTEKSFLDASDDSDSDYSAHRSPERATNPTQAYHGGLASLAAVSSLTSEAMGLFQNRSAAPQDKAEAQGFPENPGNTAPVLMQSVIVSREAPQASMADLLNNAKHRLDALASIQQAVAAPICLIYPPSPGLQVQSAGFQQHYFQPQQPQLQRSPSMGPT